MSRQRSMEAIIASEYVTIGELVRLTETRYSTLEGLLPLKQEDQNQPRRYPREETVKRIAYIKQMRKDGKTIPEIKKILSK